MAAGYQIDLVETPDIPERVEQRFLSVVIVCENTGMCRRAIDAYGRLVLLLGVEFELQSHLWKFEHLEIPKLRETAALEAGDADIIIVSACGTTEPPSGVNQWLEMWTDSRGDRPGALVELLEVPEKTDKPAWPMHLRLCVVAHRASLDLFSQTFTPQPTAPGLPVRTVGEWAASACPGRSLVRREDSAPPALRINA